MELYAVDQVSISAVRADSLKPGEKFAVSDALGRELLKKLPSAISIHEPQAKTPLVSVQTVFDGLAAQVLDAEIEATGKKLAFTLEVETAQTLAISKIADINASIDEAQRQADVKIADIHAAVDAARVAANAKLAAIAAEVAAAEKPTPPTVEGDANPQGGSKSEPAPANKSETPPKNKSAQ